MNLLKKQNIVNICAVILFSIARVLMFSYIPNTNDFAPKIVFFVLLLAYAIFTALLLVKVDDYFQNKLSVVLIFIFADFSFTLQNNSVALTAALLWELCALNAMPKKTFINKELMLIVVSFLSAFLQPYTAFSYVALAIVVYIIVNCSEKKRRNIVWAVLAGLSGAAGILVHNTIQKEVPDFILLLTSYSFGKYGLDIPFNVLAIIPAVLISLVFIKELLKLSRSEERIHIGFNKKDKTKSGLFAVIGGIVILYAFSVAGLIMKRLEMYLLINQIVPVIFVAMVAADSSYAEQLLQKLNGVVRKYPKVIMACFILVFVIQIYCMDEQGLGGMARSYIERLIY